MEELTLDDGYDAISEVEIDPEGGAFIAAPTYGVENERVIPASAASTAAAAAAEVAVAAAPVAITNAVVLIPPGEDQDKREAIEWDVDTNDTPRGITWPHCYFHAKYAVRPSLSSSLLLFLPSLFLFAHAPSLPPSDELHRFWPHRPQRRLLGPAR